MTHSIYFRILLYIYRNGSKEDREFIKYILEHERIKRGLCSKMCRVYK